LYFIFLPVPVDGFMEKPNVWHVLDNKICTIAGMSVSSLVAFGPQCGPLLASCDQRNESSVFVKHGTALRNRMATVTQEIAVDLQNVGKGESKFHPRTGHEGP